MRNVLRRMGVIAGVLAFAGAAAAVPITVTIDLLPSLEVPPVSSPAFGTAELTFDLDMLEDGVDFILELNDITSPLTQAHIHVGAPNQNGGILVTLFDFCNLGGCGPGDIEIMGGNLMFSGTAMVDAAQIAPLLEALTVTGAYVNVHTENFSSGELRGNIPIIPEPSTAALLALGLTAIAARQRAAG